MSGESFFNQFSGRELRELYSMSREAIEFGQRVQDGVVSQLMQREEEGRLLSFFQSPEGERMLDLFQDYLDQDHPSSAFEGCNCDRETLRDAADALSALADLIEDNGGPSNTSNRNGREPGALENPAPARMMANNSRPSAPARPAPQATQAPAPTVAAPQVIAPVAQPTVVIPPQPPRFTWVNRTALAKYPENFSFVDPVAGDMIPGNWHYTLNPGDDPSKAAQKLREVFPELAHVTEDLNWLVWEQIKGQHPGIKNDRSIPVGTTLNLNWLFNRVLTKHGPNPNPINLAPDTTAQVNTTAVATQQQAAPTPQTTPRPTTSSSASTQTPAAATVAPQSDTNSV